MHGETTDSHVIDDDYDMHPVASDIGSDDDFQEVLTPSPGNSPSPPPVATAERIASSPGVRTMPNNTVIDRDFTELEKISATRYSGIKVEDALLLLSFHRHVVH